MHEQFYHENEMNSISKNFPLQTIYAIQQMINKKSTFYFIPIDNRLCFFYMNDTSLNFIFINSSQHIKRGSYKLYGKTAKRLPMASLFQLVWNLY